MTRDRIARTVTNIVRLGGSRYAETLTITSTGMVTPMAAGDDGIIGNLSRDEVTNHGRIVAGAGTTGGGGGVGVDLTAGGTIINHGFIYGGKSKYDGSPVNGGDGVDIRSGKITNAGTIFGGELIREGNTNGQGGTGVHATTGSVTIINSGLIAGGYSPGSGQDGNNADAGGVGVDLSAGGRLFNSGTIYGGHTDHGFGAAVELAQHSTLVNHGTILGGNEFSAPRSSRRTARSSTMAASPAKASSSQPKGRRACLSPTAAWTMQPSYKVGPAAKAEDTRRMHRAPASMPVGRGSPTLA